MNKELYEKIENEDGSITYKKYDISKITINGKTIEEIIKILNGLDIERITGIEMTLENLSYLFKKITEEQNKYIQIQVKNFFRR